MGPEDFTNEEILEREILGSHLDETKFNAWIELTGNAGNVNVVWVVDSRFKNSGKLVIFVEMIKINVFEFALLVNSRFSETLSLPAEVIKIEKMSNSPEYMLVLQACE